MTRNVWRANISRGDGHKTSSRRYFVTLRRCLISWWPSCYEDQLASPSSLQKARDPVRSPLVKLVRARVVVGSVTTSECRVLYVLFCSLYFLSGIVFTSFLFPSCCRISLSSPLSCPLPPPPSFSW
jgi:hypothetical protein